MDHIGRWKLKAINLPTENGTVTYTRDTVPPEVADTFEEAAQSMLEFTEDGKLNVIMAVTDELREMAAAEGVEIPEGAEYFPAMTMTWELRDGKVFYDTGAEGEIMGEAIDPFEELTFTEDGCILYNYGMFIYERM